MGAKNSIFATDDSDVARSTHARSLPSLHKPPMGVDDSRRIGNRPLWVCHDDKPPSEANTPTPAGVHRASLPKECL